MGAGHSLRLDNAKRFVVPVVEPTDVPEVMVFGRGDRVGFGNYSAQLWFYVPEGTEEFYVEIPVVRGHHIRRMSIWGPDGQQVWDLNYHYYSYKGANPVRPAIKVQPEQAGRLWRIALPNNAGYLPICADYSFIMDPQIPPVYAVDRTRWFMPQTMETED